MRRVPVDPLQFDLSWLPWLIIAATFAVAWFFRRKAPAVALGLVGAVIGGLVGHHLAGGGRVPSHVSGLAVISLFVLGLVGLAFTPTATKGYLCRAAGVAVVGGAAAVSMTWIVMHEWTCTAYDPPDRRWCGGIDLFAGISGKVTLEVGIGAVVLLCLFLLSALRAPREGPRDPGSDGQRRFTDPVT